MDQTASLRDKLAQATLPSNLKDKLSLLLERVEKATTASGFKIEFDKELEYINFVLSLPFFASSVDILDINRASAILEKNHYGLHPVKERILEYLSVLILNSRQNLQVRSQALFLVGLVGSGKTSLAYSIAESLGRPLIRIPFGGLGSVREFRGESRARIEAQPGRLMKGLKDVGVNNPVILLDELDRVSTESRADVMGVLIELLDPAQNSTFLDYYVDYPFDLSKVLFIATANNTSNISVAVMDRLEVIEMPSYTDQEKIVIGKSYLLPRLIKESGLAFNTISIDDNLWPQIVRPLGYDGGIRSLQRNIQSVVRKVARYVVEGKPGPYNLTEDNIQQYIQ